MMAYPRNVNARVQAGRDGKAKTSAHGFSASNPPRVKATVHQLPGARRRQVPRCEGCGNPINAEPALCEACASGAALIARIEDRRANSLRRQALGQRARG